MITAATAQKKKSCLSHDGTCRLKFNLRSISQLSETEKKTLFKEFSFLSEKRLDLLLFENNMLLFYSIIISLALNMQTSILSFQFHPLLLKKSIQISVIVLLHEKEKKGKTAWIFKFRVLFSSLNLLKM
jgi:hypothetical protein